MLVFITLSKTLTWIIVHFNGEFWASLGAQTVKYFLAMQETGFNPWVGRIPWRREWQPTPVFAWRIPWTEDLAGYSPWGYKESDTAEQGTVSLFHWQLKLIIFL